MYTHRDPLQLQRQWAGERIHRVDEIPLYAIDRDLIAALCERLERRMKFSLSVTDDMIYLDLDGATLSGVVTRWPLQAA